MLTTYIPNIVHQIHRLPMKVPGEVIINKLFLTVLLGYFNAGDCSIRVFWWKDPTKKHYAIKST